MSQRTSSLHGGLVARKGTAMPAMSHAPLAYETPVRPARNERVLDDKPPSENFGENTPQLRRPMVPAVAPKPFVAKRPEPLPSTEKTRPAGAHRFSFRITDDQHRRLRIASAHENASMQLLLAKALDNYLDDMCACSLESCACMARKD